MKKYEKPEIVEINFDLLDEVSYNPGEGYSGTEILPDPEEV